MLAKLVLWVRQVIKKVLKVNEVGTAVNMNVAVSDKMAGAIVLWSRMYSNQAPWISGTVQSLNLPAAIASEIGRMVTIEFQSEITGSARADWLNRQYRSVTAGVRHRVEQGSAKGGLIFKPYISGSEIAVDYVQADCFYPTAFDGSGKMTGCVFIDQLTKDGRIYTRLEYHRMEKGACRIGSFAYESGSPETLGKQIELSAVPEWAELAPDVSIQNVDRLLIGYFRYPMANQLDSHSPLGVSVYSRAVDLIKESDRQYSRILWEYEGSELAVDAEAAMFKKNESGDFILPESKERLFRMVMFGNDADNFRVFNPDIRDVSLFNGLNRLFQRIEYNCGLSYGVLSDPQTVEKTAEEIKAGKQRLYTTVTDTQKALRSALDDLIYAMDIWTTLGKLAPPGVYQVTYHFDDSVITDKDTERAKDKEDVRDNIMAPWEFRAKWYGEDEQTAKKMAGEASGGAEDSGGWFQGGGLNA